MVIKEEKENTKRPREVSSGKGNIDPFRSVVSESTGVWEWPPGSRSGLGTGTSETLGEHLLGPAWCFSFKGLMHSPRTSPLSVELDPLSTLKMR